MNSNYTVLTEWHKPLEPDEIVLVGNFSTMGEECPKTWRHNGKIYKWGPLTYIPSNMVGEIGNARIYKELKDE